MIVGVIEDDVQTGTIYERVVRASEMLDEVVSRLEIITAIESDIPDWMRE